MTKKPFAILFRKLLIIALILITVDLASGKVLEYFFLRMKSGDASRTTYAMNNADQDLLIFGASRACHHYVPSIMQDSLKLTAYNCGMDGQAILYHDCLLRSVLKRAAPKIIILDIAPDEFGISTIGYEHLSCLLPYYTTHKEIRQIIDTRSRFEKIKALSNLYRYNSFILPIITNNLFKRKEDVQNGYLPLYSINDGALDDAGKEWYDTTTDSIAIHYFLSFINDAIKAKCKVFVFVSPIFIKYRQLPVTIGMAKQFCDQLGVPFFDYSQLPCFLTQKTLFADKGHLNSRGAVIYTKMISSEILKAQKTDRR